MKKCPRQLKQLLKRIKENNAQAYLIDKSLEYLISDSEDKEWVLLTDARKEIVEKLLPDDLEITIRELKGSLDDYFEEQIFSMDTVAFDGESFLDPYGGREDIELECLRLLYDPQEYFAQTPKDIMRAVKKVADTGYSATAELKEGIRTHASFLKSYDRKELALWFGQVMTSRHTGTALRLMDDTGLLAVIVGEGIYRRRNKKETVAFKKYMERIDQTLPVLDRRIVSFYLGFWNNNDKKAMANLEYDSDLCEKLEFAHSHLSDLYYIHKPVDLKDYLYKYGLKRYTFLNNISKIQTKVYGLDPKMIGVRHAVFQKIAVQNEPVFLEDLSMNGETLIAEGLAKDEASAETLLEQLVYIVHRHPEYNEPQILLSQVYRLSRNPVKKYYYKYHSRKL